MTMGVGVPMLDATGKKLEHELDEETKQDERPEIGSLGMAVVVIVPAVVALKHFRQQVQRRDREQIGAAEGDQQL